MVGTAAVWKMKLWPAACSTWRSIRIKTLIHSLIIRGLSKAKSILNQKNKNKKILLGSFRMQSSSHVAPDLDQLLYSNDDQAESSATASRLSGYLQWLEESEREEKEIDELADMFIAGCHEKFRLEKVESDRRFHEMLARSM